jgi:hypothetical protein
MGRQVNASWTKEAPVTNAWNWKMQLSQSRTKHIAEATTMASNTEMDWASAKIKYIAFSTQNIWIQTTAVHRNTQVTYRSN